MKDVLLFLFCFLYVVPLLFTGWVAVLCHRDPKMGMKNWQLAEVVWIVCPGLNLLLCVLLVGAMGIARGIRRGR